VYQSIFLNCICSKNKAFTDRTPKLPQSLAINSDYKRSLLGGLELFEGVAADEVQDLLQRCGRRDLAADEILLSPGKKNEFVYIVLSGSVNVHVSSPDAPVLVTMDVGACVGEMSIIGDRDPSAYVIGAEPTHLLSIHQSVLWEMVNASHTFAKNLLVILSERVQSHNRAIAESFGELRKFERHARTDALTGLGNRHTMEESFVREMKRCQNDTLPVSLVMIDVDNFKRFNDMFGHMAGDRALSAVAELIKTQFRPRDLIVRFGGDEFAVLLPEVAERKALEIADRAREAVSGKTGDGSDSLIKIPIRISMGVAQAGEDSTLSSLIRAADAALYRAKNAGRNRVSS
jgi:diguanylate cyclase (GGDEF)-like protein